MVLEIKVEILMPIVDFNRSQTHSCLVLEGIMEVEMSCWVVAAMLVSASLIIIQRILINRHQQIQTQQQFILISGDIMQGQLQTILGQDFLWRITTIIILAVDRC